MPPPRSQARGKSKSHRDRSHRGLRLIIGSEALPFSKTGGLADVLGALPPALARLGWDVTLVVPRYRGTRRRAARALPDDASAAYTRDVGFFEAPLGDGARALLDRRADALRSRVTCTATQIGDYPDNARRFAVLVRAALEFAARRRMRPSIVHAHDWQAGLAPVYLKTLTRSHPVLAGTPSVFTIHNLAYQGLFRARLAAAARSAVGPAAHRAAGVLGTHQLSEGRHQRRGPDHDRQPAVRDGNPDAGVRLRVRRHPPAPRAPISSAS